MMSELIKLRVFGAGWTLLVGALAVIIEPALLNGVFAVVLLALAAGWAVAASIFSNASRNVSTNTSADRTRVVGADARLLSETGGTLLRCCQAFGSQLDVTRDELMRVQQLFSEAIDKLIASFHSMTVQSRRQQELMAAQDMAFSLNSKQGVEAANVAGMSAGASGTIVELLLIAESMEQSVGQAVMSLQFQDMVTQLIGHVSRRMEQLHDVVRDIEGASAVVVSAADSGFGPQQKERLRAYLTAAQTHVDQLADHAGGNPVRQESFSSGEVELF